MKRLLAYLFPVLVLTIFIFIMNSNIYFQQPKKEKENFPKYLELVREDIRNARWQEAEKNLEKLETAWSQIVVRVQFSVERDEINQLNKSLARLKGAISAQDKGETLADLNEAFEHWDRLDE